MRRRSHHARTAARRGRGPRRDRTRAAIEAGFDGIELHGANGYLIEQFLNANLNTRSDGYGGSAAGRNRFAREVARATVAAIGADRVAIRLSPYGAFNEMGAFAEVEPQFLALARELGALGLAYLHLVDHSSMGDADLIAFGRPALANPDLVERLQHDVALHAPDFATFYTPGEKGYTDYP